RTLVCSMHDEALFADRALKAGAMGYIGKEEATTQVVEAMRHVLGGKVWLSPNMTERVFQGLAKGIGASQAASIESLTDRELEVFGLIGRGLGTSKIAERLHLSVKTIETHRENIKKKLNLRSGSELTRRAMQWTLGQDED
ncbi:MAG: response regulator transcription factor, partial [Acidobacteriota bacterium]